MGLLALATVWVFRDSSHRTLAPIEGIKPGEDAGGLRFPSLHLYVHADDGTPQWTLTAINATISKDQHQVHCDSIRDGRFYRGSAVAATFTAGPANFDRYTQDLDLSGPIQVDATNQVHLRCGSLRYTFSTRRLTAQGPLQISTPVTTFTAGRLDADLSLSELRFGATPTQTVTLRSRIDGAQQL